MEAKEGVMEESGSCEWKSIAAELKITYMEDTDVYKGMTVKEIEVEKLA